MRNGRYGLWACTGPSAPEEAVVLPVESFAVRRPCANRERPKPDDRGPHKDNRAVLGGARRWRRPSCEDERTLARKSSCSGNYPRKYGPPLTQIIDHYL